MIIGKQNWTVDTSYFISNLAGIIGSDLKISQNIHLVKLHGFLQVYYMKTCMDMDFQTSGLLNRRFFEFFGYIFVQLYTGFLVLYWIYTVNLFREVLFTIYSFLSYFKCTSE